MVQVLSISEAEFVEGSNELKDKMAKFSEAFLDAAAIVAKLHAGAHPALLDAMLATHLGMAPDEIAMMIEVHKAFDESGVDVKRFSPFTFKLLLEARADVRSEAITLAKSSHPLDAARIQRLAIHRDRILMGDEGLAERARESCLQSFAAKAVPAHLRALEFKVDEVIRLAEAFRFEFAPEEPSDGEEMYQHLEGYDAAHRQVKLAAAAALDDFEHLLGSSFEGPSQSDSDARAVGLAHEALRRLAFGNFGHVGGFAFEDGPGAVRAAQLQDALYYMLSKQKPDPKEQSRLYKRPPRLLEALELCAGAGGQAIGLMSAGFGHHVLFEKNKKRVKTLRQNWPQWHILTQDVDKLGPKDLERWRGIDLLAGGPPCEPFSKGSSVGDRGRENNLFPAMIRAVRWVRPRAFMFETVPGFKAAKHVAYLAAVRGDLAALGYRVDIVHLNAENLGLPQSRERMVLVGIRKDQPGEFLFPDIRLPRRYVGEVLGSIIIKYETPDELKDSVLEGSDQWKYDRWAEFWRKAHAKDVLPTVVTATSENRPKRLAHKMATGFDFSIIAEHPPTVEDIAGLEYKPMPTVEVLAAAQGFPPGWKFHAEHTGNVDMVGDAFPPILAKAVGLSIYTALTGIEFDLPAALSTPLIDEKMIGKRPFRLGHPLHWHIRTQVEEILRGEDAIPAKAKKMERKRIFDQLVEKAEPNKAARAELVRAVNSLRDSWLSEMGRYPDD